MPVPFDRQRSNLAWVEGRVSSGHSTARDPALSTYWDHTHIYVLRPYFDLQLPNFAKWRNYRTGDFLHGSCRPDPNGEASGGQTFLGLGPPISYTVRPRTNFGMVTHVRKRPVFRVGHQLCYPRRRAPATQILAIHILWHIATTFNMLIKVGESKLLHVPSAPGEVNTSADSQSVCDSWLRTRY